MFLQSCHEWSKPVFISLSSQAQSSYSPRNLMTFSRTCSGFTWNSLDWKRPFKGHLIQPREMSGDNFNQTRFLRTPSNLTSMFPRGIYHFSEQPVPVFYHPHYKKLTVSSLSWFSFSLKFSLFVLSVLVKCPFPAFRPPLGVGMCCKVSLEPSPGRPTPTFSTSSSEMLQLSDHLHVPPVASFQQFHSVDQHFLLLEAQNWF